ncbi:MAG: DUF362 domain-containing protein [candidate division KSB1 bacterium]|nr:DUF362 domain-containing protein [candidate division KSB1 bacterium]MDZ7300576.1 DUF362 domain-containing protein [candidate division KSB1 bacterium]MDZ7309713.1 DUF362 domain-containing protein [candidate division KSB1 bacterium]
MKPTLDSHTCEKTEQSHAAQKQSGLKRPLIGWSKLLFPLLGLASLLWFLIRVIPKPSRATYPCMKVAAPLASGFIIYIMGWMATIFFFRKAKEELKSHAVYAVLFLVIAVCIGSFSFLQNKKDTYACPTTSSDPYPANTPIGTAKGIFPGRVVWAYNPEATNENCNSTSYGDGYFLEKNNNQAVIDQMLAEAVMALTGEATAAQAWEAIFKYHNENHRKGGVGYKKGEKIFIKINSVHASNLNADGSIKRNSNYGLVDTSPQAVLAVLRQLINHAGIDQNDIYVGDPFRDIFKHCYDMWHNDFPNVHYLDRSGFPGRERFVRGSSPSVFYADKKKVLPYENETLYAILEEAEYLINIPAMKGHRWAGVTFFAKNHFGSITRSDAQHLHPGLMRTTYDGPLRDGYKKYRVLVDLMGNKNLGGKTLLYVMDGLWATSYEHDPPCQFRMAPFNNDWASSIFVSLDPVAIASVCLDFMQAEFHTEDLTTSPPRYAYANFDGVDDYLHQAASPAEWPDDIVYDPENDGIPLTSLGVHEHWNNPIDMQYSRNLGTGEGIELVALKHTTAVAQDEDLTTMAPDITLYQSYPNPFNSSTQITYSLPVPAKVNLTVLDVQGQAVCNLVNSFQRTGTHTAIWNGLDENGSPVSSGIYFYQLSVDDGYGVHRQIHRMALLR